MKILLQDPHCWIDCLKLELNGSDPSDCRVRPDEGLSAVGELCPGSLYVPSGTSIFSSLIKFFANEHGYDANSLIGMPYDWRLAPLQLQQRDMFLTTLKFRLETAIKMHGLPAIVISHSMGTNLFLYFVEWLKVNEGKGWRKWLRKHVGAFIGIAAPLLGSPGSIKSVLSGHTFGLTISEAQAKELELSFPSTHFLNPRSSRQEYDYSDPIALFRSASGGMNMSFGVEDIENGEIFRVVGSIYQDKDLSHKHTNLRELYLSDPINPLGVLPQRPPVQHVVMVYGVDVSTEVGYVYRMHDSDGSTEGGPLLEEIYMEEPCSEPSPIMESGPLGDDLCYLNETVEMEAFIDICKVDMERKVLRRVSSVEGRRETPIDKSCRSNIVSVSNKLMSQRRRFLRKGRAHRSGDGSVPYLSLQFAHSWLEGERWEEHRPARVRHPWPKLMAAHTVDPATDIYHSRRPDGDTTEVAEIVGLNHIEICSNAYLHEEFVEPMVQRVFAEARRRQRRARKSLPMLERLKKWWGRVESSIES